MPERVAVEGGSLAVEVLPGTSEPVLAVHGVSSTRRLWLWLRDVAPDLSLVAPDLRGRGDSVGVAGPSSVGQHARDLVAVLDALELESAHVCGMSMGGFVGVALAVAHPERVRSLTLVDGGLPMRVPPGLTRENVALAFADRLGRLVRQWASAEEYLQFFTSSTAPLLDVDDPLLRRYADHDLVDGRVRLDEAPFLDDVRDVFFGPERWRELAVPTRLLASEWSVGAGSAPAYSDEALAAAVAALDGRLDVERIGGVDHAGIVMTRVGAVATAAALRASQARTPERSTR